MSDRLDEEPPEVSVVIATHDRNALVADLLRALADQTISPERFEVVVVDDGSPIPARPALLAVKVPYRLTVIEQENMGAAGARHAGILRARGAVIIILDDDMRPCPELLARHLEAHERGATLVLGHIAPNDDDGSRRPLFERMHATLLERQWRAFREGRERVRGIHVCTGNVSFRRADYLAAGGFDRSLARSEDRELGVRLERAGARLTFAAEARSVHRSDVTLSVWRRRNYLYGIYDTRIAHKHAEEESADPWRFFFLIHPASRALVAATVIAPGAGALLARLALRVAEALDAAGAERAALAGATLAYGLDYFRGVRAEAGSLGAALRDLRGYLHKRAHSPSPPRRAPPTQRTW